MTARLGNDTRIGYALIVGIGLGLSFVHLLHAISEDENLRTFLLGIFIPLVFALSVTAGGVVVWRREQYRSHILSVGIWTAVGTGVLAAAGGFTILYQQQYGVTMDEQPFVVVNAASAGGLVGFITGVYDARQRQAQAQVEQINQQLTVFNRVLRHDIRNIGNVIQGNASLLTRESTDTAARATKIQQQATDLVKLGDQATQIEDLLDEEGQQRRVLDITAVVESVCERLDRDYPNGVVDCALDSRHHVRVHHLVEPALLNVIENGLEHNDKETPRVAIDSSTTSEGGTEYVDLHVADNGPGMPDTEVEVLERGHETELEHTSGLGLWLTSWIITNAGGDIRFEANDPEGSIVTLRLERASPGSGSESESEPDPLLSG